MTAMAEEIRMKALALPSAEKLALADELYASVGPVESENDLPLSDAWKIELDRRLDDARAGRTQWVTEEEFFTSLDTRLERVRP